MGRFCDVSGYGLRVSLSRICAYAEPGSVTYQVDLTRRVNFFLLYKRITLKRAHRRQTPSTISGFFLAMIMFPEVLKKAQAEVDAVVGHERLPTMQDHEALPYVSAICKELLRWNVVVPLGTYISHVHFHSD